MTKYEYGIRLRRSHQMHRTGMTADDAHEFMNADELDGADLTAVFEIVRRPLGAWEPAVAPRPDLARRTQRGAR